MCGAERPEEAVRFLETGVAELPGSAGNQTHVLSNRSALSNWAISPVRNHFYNGNNIICNNH